MSPRDLLVEVSVEPGGKLTFVFQLSQLEAQFQFVNFAVMIIFDELKSNYFVSHAWGRSRLIVLGRWQI